MELFSTDVAPLREQARLIRPFGAVVAAYRRDLSSAAVWAGVTAFIWYAMGIVPVQIAISERLGLTAAQTSSWVMMVWLSGAVSSLVLSFHYRQPLAVAWSSPALLYLGSLAGQFSFAELAGANLLAGVLILVLGLSRLGGLVLVWFPLPLVMGMFAGSILAYVTRLVQATVEDGVIAGAAVAGFLLGRALGVSRFPPLGFAVVCGGLAVLLTHHGAPPVPPWELPALAVPQPVFSPAAFLAVSLPMVVVVLGAGHVQGLGFLLAQGYRVPVNTVTTAIGINSIVNALFGGVPSMIGRTGVAVVGGPEAGPLAGRYWASVVAAILTLTIVLGAASLAALILMLPGSYVAALAGLAICSSLQDALGKAFSGTLRFGALAAFVVAATPFTLAGIPSAFWAIVAGLAASVFGERADLLAHWRGNGASNREHAAAATADRSASSQSSGRP